MIIDIPEQKPGSDFGDLLSEYGRVSAGVESRAREKESERLQKEREAYEKELERKGELIVAEILQKWQVVGARESGPVSSRAGQVVDRYYIEEQEKTVGSCCSAGGDNLSPACIPDPKIIRRQVTKPEYDAYQEQLKKDAARAAAACNCV